MAEVELTDRQRERIQRWFDGELEPSAREEVEELIETEPAAEEYLERLRELRSATEVAHDAIRRGAQSLSSAESIAEAAATAPPPEDQPLEELAPLLERYYDGETLDGETQTVERLLGEREDARVYLAALEELGDSVRAADRELVSAVDFDTFREDLGRRLDCAPGDPELIHRYVDGELEPQERTQVEEWLERNDEAAEAVSALRELREVARIATEEVRSRADMDGFWEGIESRIDEEKAADDDSATVVSLETERSDEDDSDLGAPLSAPDDTDGSVVEFFSEYRSHLVGAAAAAVVLLAVAALVRPGLFQGERVVEKQKKTVVIVDSVEQKRGSSVVVDGPMRTVGARTGGAKSADDEDGTEEKGNQKKQEKPTVIWVLDEGDGDESASDEPEEEPSESEGTGDNDADDERDESRDAGGAEDAGPPPSGQPI